MKLDLKAEPHWVLDLVMGPIRGTIVYFCILFLAISWPGGSLGAPTSVLPLLKQYYTSNIDSQQTLTGISSSDCNSYVRSSASQIPTSAAHRQQLLNQASILLKQLSSSAPIDTSVSIDTPCSQSIENQERILLQNLINRLGAFKKNSIVAAANSSSSLPVISEATYNSITNHYLHIRLLTLDLLNPEDVQNVQPALDSLYKTFVKIITGQLLNVELPNLCSATLTLNTQLKATDAPLELQEEVTYFIKTLTAALTGQSQVTILGLCDCLNDLETSVVTVVEHDKSQKLQYLLSHLVEAVTNAVVSGGDVGCNIIEIVQRYVTSIKQAVQEEAHVRARQIYSSVLSFEEELYKVLLASKPIAIEATSSSQNPTLSNLKTEEFYLNEIERLSEAIYGNRKNLVKSAVQILLNIKKSEDPSPEDESTSSDPSKATLARLKKIDDLLRSVHSYPQTDSTHVVEAIVEELSPLPQTDVSKVLNALDPVLEDSNDTDKPDDPTAIVDNGGFLIIKEQLVQETDIHGNVVDIVKSGVYNLVDPKTNVSWSGNYVIQDEVIQLGPNDKIYAKRSGVYDVNKPQDDSSTSASPRVKRQANFEVERITVPQVDQNGNSEVTEDGKYSLTDPNTGKSKSGNFVVENSITKSNPDGSIETIKSAIVYADKHGATLPSKPSLEPGTGYFLFDEHIFESPDSDGNYGNGVYNIKNPATNEYVTGTYTIQKTSRTENPDGSVDLKTSGLIYVDGIIRDSSSDNFDIVLYIVNGSEFNFNDHIVYVTDVNGNVSPIITGVFGETDHTTGITRVGDYVVQSIITTENPDGSSDTTKFGRFSNINFVASSTGSSTKSNKSPESTESSTITSGKHLPLSQGSFQSLVNRLNPAVKPVHPGTGPSTDDHIYISLQPVTDPSSTTSPNSICNDATSLVSNGTTFIIDQLITPVLDAEGNVIDEITMGTYHFMDIRTNVSWSGAFEVEDSLIETISSGKTKLTASGIFDVTPTEDDCDSKIIAKFSIESELNVYVDKSGVVKASEEGTYYLTDPTTGTTKTGTFVVQNTVSRSQPGGAMEFIKSGLLFIDESDATSSSPVEEPLVPGYDGYFLFDDHILKSPDHYGNQGSGVYNIKDPRTNEYLTGTYVIENTSTTNNPDGTLDTTTEGVIYVGGFDPNSKSRSSLSPLIIRNGAKFTFNDHLEYVTDSYGHISLIGYGQSSQVDPETGVIQFGNYVIFNVATTKDGDGNTDVRRFGVLPIDCDSDLTGDSVYVTETPTEPSSTTRAPKYSTSTTHAPKGTSRTTKAPKHSTSTTHAPKESSRTTEAPEYSTSTTNGPKGSSRTTKAPKHSTSTTHAPKGSSRTTEAPEYLTTTTHAPKGSSRTTQAPKHSASTTHAPKGSSRTTKAPKHSTSTTQAPTYSTSTTKAPTNHPHKPYVLNTDYFEALVNSLNPIKPTQTSPDQTPEKQDEDLPTSTDVVNVSGYPIYDPTAIVTDGAYFIIDGQVVPQLDAEGNTVGLLKTGSYSIRDSRTNNFWSGSFEVEDCSIKSNTYGQIDVTGSGRFNVTLPDSCTTDTNNQAIFSITDLVSVVVDEMGTSRATEKGTYCLTNPITDDSTYGTFVVENSLSKMNPDGSIDLVKSGILYVDEPCTTSPNDQPSNVNYGGYFLTDQHLLETPDCDGNYGTGVYNIKDPKTNEYTSGTYVIQETSTVNNTDGTIDVTTKGLIYVDSSRSSSPLISSDPSLAIINGAQFTLVDHISYVTDAYGRVNIVGSGVFTQTDPKTNTNRSVKYIIQDIVNVNNPDGSQDGIESGIFYYTNDSDSSTDPSATTSKSGSDETLTELNGYLKALFSSLDVLKTHKEKTSNGTPKTSESTTASVSGSGIKPDHVVLQRSNVVSAINGQCLSPGDIVVVQTNSGTALLATIQDSYSPVIFYVTNLADLAGRCASANKVWTIPENDFSKQDRSLFATVLKSGSQPCYL